MKRIILTLLVALFAFSSFSPAPVSDSPKDNWVYGLKAKPTSTVTCNAFYFNPSGCDGVISLNSTASDLQQYPRMFRVTIKFRIVTGGNVSFGYSSILQTMGANENYHGDYYNSDWPCSATIVQVTAAWYYI